MKMVLNTEWAQVEVIDLINDGSGLAFGIIGGRSTGVVVKTILPGGVADRDGRLQSGDHILQIGDVNLRGLGSEQVASVLRQCGIHVRLVVARPVEPTSPDYQALGSHAPIVPTKLLGDADELDRHLIENGYAETLALSQPNYSHDSYVYSRTTSSELDFHPLSGIIDVVKNPLPIGPTPIIPSIQTRTSSNTSTIELLPLDMALRGQSLPDTETFDVELYKDDYGLGITVAGYVCEKEELSGIFVKSISAGSAASLCQNIQVNDRIVQVGSTSLQGFTNHQAVELLRHAGPVVKLRLERYLRGPKYEQLQQAIRANQLKPPSPPSPSVSSLPKFSVITDGYSVTEIEVEGESRTTMTSSVLLDHQQIQPSSYDYNEDVEIVIDTPSFCYNTTNKSVINPVDQISVDKWLKILGRDIEIVVAHLTKDTNGGLGISLEGTVDVEDGKEVRPHHYIRSILPEGPVGVNGLLESGDELLEVNGTRLLGLNHLEVVSCLKQLPEKVCMVCARHSENSAPHRIINTSQDKAAFATRSILGGSLQNLIHSAEISRLVKAKSDSSLASTATSPGELSGSRCKSRSLEPITGLAAWSDEPHLIELMKGERGGLGFSILDYQDPINPSETVIVIRSLVPGGVAQTDGRLIPGDRLLAVNDTQLARASLDKAVQVLKGAPKGIVKITVAKPLLCHENASQSSQISSLSFQECIDTDEGEDRTGLEDFQECLEEYQENLEVVQICVNNSESNHTSLHSLQNSTTTSSFEDLPKITKLTKQPSLTTNIEKKYKHEGNNCLRVRESSDEKEGYETCVEELDSDLSLTTKCDKAGEEFLYSSNRGHDDDQLKSYDEQSNSFGSDQFFLVQYIDDEDADRTEKIILEQIDEELNVSSLRLKHNETVLIDCREEQLKTTPRKYVRCLSEYYNDYEEVLEECRMHSLKESQNDNQNVKISDINVCDRLESDGETIIGSKDFSNDNLSESVFVPPRWESAPDILTTKSASAENVRTFLQVVSCDPRCRRKSAVPTPYQNRDDSTPMTVTRTTLADAGGKINPDDTRQENGGVVVNGVMADSNWGPQRLVQVVRPVTGGSLGISIVGGKVDLYNAESVLGIFVKNVIAQSPAGQTGELKTGDRILEVDGVDLRNASHQKAVEAIRSAGNPVSFLVQSLIPWGDSDLPNLPNNIEKSRSPTPTQMPEATTSPSPSVEIAVLTAPPSDLALNDVDLIERPQSARGMYRDDKIPDEEPPVRKSPTPPTLKYSDSEEESSDEEDTRDQEGRMYTAKGEEVAKKTVVKQVTLIVQIANIDRASAGNVKRTKEEIDADPEQEDEFGYTQFKVKKKYHNLGGSIHMVQIERSPQGSLGLSLAGHRDRTTMASFVVGLNPSGAAHRLGSAGIQVGDEILEVNGIVLHGRCHLNASAIIKGLSGPVFKVLVLRRKAALDDIAVRPITQFPVTLDDETAEEKYCNFRNVRTVTLKKGQQSLGIMIIEGKHAEVGQGIFISDIQEGSAAEKAGLDIGDMILAVNKDTLVNASYDVAASLLKKTEGLVVLVVCNPNKRVDGDTAQNSIKTPSRPPSRPPSAASKLGGLKTSAPPSRPTTPEPVADPATCAIIPGKETVIELSTENKPLGISFVGGKDTLLPKAIIVNEVYSGGALAKDDRVRAGDQLIEVNGVKLVDVTNSTASCALRQILPKVRLTILRPERVEFNTIEVELAKKSGKGVGLAIMARKTEPGVYISDILPGSVADVDGRIMRGDNVVCVNGVDLTKASAEEAGAALKTATGRIVIKLQRYKPVAR